MMQRLLSSPVWVYVLLGWPAWPLIFDLFSGDQYHAQMMHLSGKMSVRLLALSLAITPLMIVIRHLKWGLGIGRYALRMRRHIGLLAFYYALLHLAHYVDEADWDMVEVWLQAQDPPLWTAWIGMIALLAMAVTSNDVSQRLLARRWKSLHQWIYPAAILIWAHWFFYEFFPITPLLWALALCGIKAPQIWRALRRYLSG